MTTCWSNKNTYNDPLYKQNTNTDTNSDPWYKHKHTRTTTTVRLGVLLTDERERGMRQERGGGDSILDMFFVSIVLWAIGQNLKFSSKSYNLITTINTFSYNISLYFTTNF
jgi:hypothetical protein